MSVLSTFAVAVVTTSQLGLANSDSKAPGAAQKEKPLPTVDQVLDKYVQAIGGKAMIQKQTSRVSKGTYETPTFNASGTVEVYAKAPNKVAFAARITGWGVLARGFNGSTGWIHDPENGFQDMPASQLAMSRRDSDFYRPLKMKQIYPGLQAVRLRKVQGREAVILQTPQTGESQRFLFDVENGLLIREVQTLNGSQGTVNIVTEYSDYRTVDGIKIPFYTRQVSPGYTFIIKLNEVKHGVQMDDQRFDKPQGKG